MPHDFPLSRVVAIAGAKDRELLGSGFRLSARRVLTARHVVGDRPEVYVFDPAGAKWAKPRAATVVWPAEGVTTGLDAVLLETPPVEDVSPWAAFLEERLGAATEFEAYGYPDAWHNPAQRKLAKGNAGAFASGDKSFELTITGGYPDRVKEWDGVSGAAILCRLASSSGWTLAGLVERGYYKYKGRSLQAVSLPALLADPEFRAALELPGAQADCAVFQAQVARLLRTELAVKVAARHEAWTELYGRSPDPERLAQAICLETPVEDVAAALRDAFVDAVETKSWDAAGQLFELLHYALPSAFLSHPPGSLPATAESRVDLPVLTDLLAEIANAAIDGRPVRFADPGGAKDDDIPRPLFQVPWSLEGGIDPWGERKLDDVARQLAVHLALDPDRSSRDADERAFELITCLATRRLEPDRAPLLSSQIVKAVGRAAGSGVEARRAELLRVVDQELGKAAKNGRRFYLIDNADGEDARLFLEALRARLPRVRQVHLSGQIESLAWEVKIHSAVREAHSQHERAKKEPR